MAQVTLGGNPVHTFGELPALGSLAPDFTLVKDDMSEISLSDYKGKKVVLNIFPSVDTGVCSASVREFNKRAAGLDNTAVVCVSVDLPFALKRFCSAEGIENVDTATAYRKNNSFGEDYGVVMTDGGFQSLLARSVVVLDEDGKVTYTELVPEIGQEPDYDQAIAAL